MTLRVQEITELALRFVYGEEWVLNKVFKFLPYYMRKLMLFGKKQLISLAIPMDLL